MGSCEPSVLVEESLCGFPDGTVRELEITLGDMGGVTLESVDEFIDFQGCKDTGLDPDSSSGAACKLGNCIEDSVGQQVTEQFYCSEVACPLSNTNWDTTGPVDGCCDSSQNLRANLVGSSVGLGASISGRDDSFNRQQDTAGSILEQKPQDECRFLSSNTSGETRNPVDGCHAYSKKIAANSVDFRLESPISGWDGSPYGQQDMGVLAHEQKLKGECELSGLCSSESDQCKHLCYSGTIGLYLERQGPCHEDEMGQSMVAEEMSLASVPLTFSRSKSSPCMELKVPGEADGLSAEAVTGLKEIKEEQCDVITRISVSMSTQVSLKEDNTCNLMEGPSDVASGHAVEEKIPQLSFQLCDVVDIGSCKSLAVPDLEVGCAPSCAPICGGSVDSTVQMYNEDTDCAKPNNVSGPLEVTVTDSQEVVEQKFDVLLGTLVNQSSQELRIEENICNLMQRSLNVASECSGEESSSLKSPLPLNVVANGSSKRSCEHDLEEINVGNGYLMCSSMVDAIDSAGGKGKANSKSHSVSESNGPDGVRVLPRRSTRVSKLNQMNETRNAGNQCNNKVKSSLPKRAIGISFKIARRKRSYPCKSARSSSWGVLGSIMQVFKQNEGILTQDSDLVQAQARGSRKTESRQGSEKRNRIRASRDSRKSNGETNASIGCVRLKVKMGEKVSQNNLKDVLPQGDNPSANGETIINESLSELNCGSSIEIPCVANDVEMEHKLGEDLKLSNRSLEMPVTPLDVSVLDANLADKDLVSIVTQDMSVGNSGDCHVSSQIGNESLREVAEIKNSDLGTSPHSEVINMIQEVQVGAGIQVDLPDASFDLAQAVVPPGDVMGSNVLLMKVKKGKRNGKIKGSQNPVGGCTELDENMHGPANLNKTRKLSKRRSRQKVVEGNEAIISSNSQNASSNNSSNEGFGRDSFPSSGLVELGLCHEALKKETSIEACELLSHNVGYTPSESWTLELSAAKTKGSEVSKASKSSAGVNKSRSRVSDSVRGRRKIACAKEDALKSKRKGKVKEEVISDLDVGQQENHPELGGSINVPLVKKDSETWGPDELSKFNLVANETSNMTRNNAGPGNNVPPVNISSFNVVSNGVEEQSLPPRIAWVCCDDCLKWRCISATLADSIEETNCKWTCKDNADKAFADCSIPQEKSNAEINRELDISDEEDAYDRRSNYKALEVKQPTVHQQASWRLIKSNLFLHRSRKTQTIDEVMVCHCKPPPVGSLGCGDECLNRMLNIECVKGACPCGDLCSNQQFQKRNYAKFKQFRCGKKGYGLQLLENVSEGQFLIEYVGEVLDLHEYEARQREYASRGQKHFYFMTLNGSEVIDACAKGNLGRFINHSCEPNCRTEKWMVNGEICIGLFAIRDIKKGEEVTFDYNYVRVYGAAAKKCVCGSSVCRGYIGGDPLNAETIVRGDSDEEFPEPLMFDEDGCNEDNIDGIIPSTSPVIGAGADAAAHYTQIPLQAGDISSKSEPAIVGSNILSEKEDTLRGSVSFGEPSRSEFSLKMEDGLSKSVSSSVPSRVSVQREDGMSKTPSSIQLVEVSLTKEETTDKYLCKVQTLESSSSSANSTKKCISSSVGTNKSRSDTVEDKPNISKSRPRVKASWSGSSKKGKCIVYPVITNKSQVMAKPRKQVDGAIRSRFEGVEEKLNELLDGDGGISKRKDASKGYLKLLVLTAASGDNGNGEAFQSARDLSIILDALMKTKSRTVLTDIINKNGLQMLHNILKQNRGDFKKIPILRKLLKVLEFLALKGILTLEHIHGGPPHPGMESFKDSILTLTRHSDVQVHQIARTFRDRWIPRYSRRFNYFDRDDSKLEPQSGPNGNWFAPSHKRWQDPGVRPTEINNCASQATVVPTPAETNTQEGSSVPAVGSCPASGTRKRKRKSRWDQPAETKDDPPLQHIEEQKIEPNSGQKMDSSPQKLEIIDPVLDQVIDVNREKKTRSGCIENLPQQNEVSVRIDAAQHIEEDVPPGFASYLNGPAGPSNVGTIVTAILPAQIASLSNCGFEVMTGLPQERFLSHLPVSHGIPFPLVQQLGMLQPETIDCWSIAPGVPFHPFPPLPPFPREKSNPPPPSSAPDPMVVNGHVEAVQLPSHRVAAHNMDPSVPSTSGARPDAQVTKENNQDAVERRRGSSYGLGKRCRRWDDDVTPRSPWRRNSWDNSRNGVRSVVVGKVANDSGGHCCSQGLNNEGENVSSCFYQHKPHQYHH